MLTTILPHTDLVVSRLCYGCMRLAGVWDPTQFDRAARNKAFVAIDAALEAGYTFFDHADIYGATKCEEVFGEYLEANPGVRERMVIATKCGVRFPGNPNPDSPQRWDFSHGHIVKSAENSLKRLKVEVIDLYQLHRPDYLANPLEIACAFKELRDSGKVRFFGVSNFRPSLVQAVQAALDFPLISHQVEISLLKQDCLEDGTLDQCLEKRIAPLAWSPLAQGRLGGDHAAGENEELSKLHAVMDKIGQATGLERSEVALAWLLLHPAQIIPVVGTTRPERIHASVKALDTTLSREDWYRLIIAARGKKLP